MSSITSYTVLSVNPGMLTETTTQIVYRPIALGNHEIVGANPTESIKIRFWTYQSSHDPSAPKRLHGWLFARPHEEPVEIQGTFQENHWDLNSSRAHMTLSRPPRQT